MGPIKGELNGEGDINKTRISNMVKTEQQKDRQTKSLVKELLKTFTYNIFLVVVEVFDHILYSAFQY